MCKKLVAVLLFCAATMLSGAAVAQGYPTRTVHLIVPFPPGAFTDTFARLLAEKLSSEMGQTVIVENRAGAGGNIGAGVVAKAAPDGYTLLMGTIASAISVSVYKKLSYDLIHDLAPVSLVATIPSVLVVNKALPVQSVGELIKLARAEPGKLNLGSSGYGGLPHLAGEMFKIRTKIDVMHVPFKGISPALTAVISGRVSLMFASIDSVLPYVKAGQIKALAVTSKERSPALPGVPTMSEAGVDGFEISAWAGVMAPVQTSKEIVSFLNTKIGQALQSDEMQRKLRALGAQTVSSTPDEFARFLSAEIGKWGDVARTSHITID